MEGKVLQISPEEAQYLDPSQIASIQMVDGTNVVVVDNEGEFVEETQQNESQYQTQEVQGQQQPQLRGRGLGALAGLAAGTALLGTAAAIGGAMRRPYYPYYARPMYGPMLMPRPMMMRPMMRPMFF